jgi:hypothetical protein
VRGGREVGGWNRCIERKGIKERVDEGREMGRDRMRV